MSTDAHNTRVTSAILLVVQREISQYFQTKTGYVIASLSLNAHGLFLSCVCDAR